MPVEHTAFFKFRKWSVVLLPPILTFTWICWDLRDNYLYKTGQRKSLLVQIEENQREALAQFNALKGPNSPYVSQKRGGNSPYSKWE